MELYLGIDAGGSHTRARLATDAGDVLGSGAAGPANTPAGLPHALAAVAEAAAQATRAAGLNDDAIATIRAGLGIAGLNRRGVLAGLRGHAFPYRSIRFASDAAIAQLGAHAGGDGAVVVVGTGSIGFGRVGDDVFTIGGYGFPVSDEGSGAELGLRAIRRALWARDGRIAHSDLTRAVLADFGGSAGAIVDWTGAATPRDYAAFAPLVMDHAERGDPVAALIVGESTLRLERLIRALFDRGVVDCCLMGGVAARIRSWLSAGISERLREPKGDALDGAILLAHRAEDGASD